MSGQRGGSPLLFLWAVTFDVMWEEAKTKVEAGAAEHTLNVVGHDVEDAIARLRVSPAVNQFAPVACRAKAITIRACDEIDEVDVL